MEEKYPKVFIIILNYNGKDTIKNCLNSVFYSDYFNAEAVVVDNDSKDGSLESAKNLYPKFHFIKNKKDAGSSAGNNVGIRFALEKMADYVFLLNNDTVLKENTLSKLIETAEKEGAGIFSPLIYDQNGNVWFSEGEIKWSKLRTTYKNIAPKNSVPYETEYVPGCAMLIKKEVFKKIGLLSEDYFLYYEDADFCVRAKKNGFKCLVIPSAKATHFEKSEFDLSNKIYWLVFSGLIFFRKNTPLFHKIWARPYLYLRKAKNIIDNFDKDDQYAPAIKKAYNDFKIWRKEQKYPL
ncbi:MAG: glycosyltransferase family 2 protein [Patescibacteria group bacterium]